VLGEELLTADDGLVVVDLLELQPESGNKIEKINSNEKTMYKAIFSCLIYGSFLKILSVFCKFCFRGELDYRLLWRRL
jgi:hypothetical protein